MASPDELRTDIGEARDALRQALATAGETWERQPGGGAGEEAWSARHAAEHVIAAEVFFATAVCTACNYPGPESPWGREKLQLGTAAAAEDAFEKAVAAADSKIKYVTDTDLEMKHDRMGTVADVMSRWSEHLRDHAQQIRATANP